MPELILRGAELRKPIHSKLTRDLQLQPMLCANSRQTVLMRDISLWALVWAGDDSDQADIEDNLGSSPDETDNPQFGGTACHFQVTLESLTFGVVETSTSPINVLAEIKIGN
jgi:hypothetical protein